MNKLLIGVILCATFAAWKQLTAQPAPQPEPASPALMMVNAVANSAAPVTIYTTEWCGYCKKAKAHMKAKGIAYVEYDVEKEADRAKEFRQYGGRGVPLLVVRGKVMHGFDAQELDELTAAN